MIHDTGAATAESTLAWFAQGASGVSSHYLVGPDGSIYALVPETSKAWHAGVSSLDGVPDVNTYSIGIEVVDSDDRAPYPAVQWRALVDLTAHVAKRYAIPIRRIVGHCHIAPGRKVDPGPDFDWYQFGLDIAAAIIRRD